MLIRLYIEALLVDAAQADAIWELWNRREIGDSAAAFAWLSLARR